MMDISTNWTSMYTQFKQCTPNNDFFRVESCRKWKKAKGDEKVTEGY